MIKSIRLSRSLGLVLAALPLFLLLSGCGRPAVEPAARPAPVPPLLTDNDLADITADLRAQIPSLMKQARIPGLQIALIRDGRIAWHRSFGLRDAKTGDRVMDDTIFEAASLTKPFFAYYAMKLVDQGVLDLDRPLVAYLPAAEVVKIIGHPLEEKGFHREWLVKVTARHILSHSSGFPHGESGKPYPLAFEPGTKWKYSADGYFYLQAVIEHLKGEPLDKLMQKDILDPLGMTRSCMVWKPGYETVMASGHGLLGRPEAFRKRTKPHAGASLYTTAEDYAKFVCAVLNGEGFRPETWKTMIVPQIDMDKEKGLGWSLGFGTQSDANGPALWQWGDYGIFRNYLIMYPEQKSGVVYFANSEYGLSVCPDVIRHSLGGQAMGSVALGYLPYDSPLFKFLWDVEAQGPPAVNELKELRRRNPDLFNSGWINYFAENFQNADMIPEALALFEFSSEENPRSGSAALAAAEGYMKTGDTAKAERFFERALSATEDKVDADSVRGRLDYIAALGKPVPADLSGEWFGKLWTNDGQTDNLTMVLKNAGAKYEGTVFDKLGLIPAGTVLLDAVRTGEQFSFSCDIPLEGGMHVQLTTTLQGETMKGRWAEARGGTGGAVEFVRRK